MEAVEYGGYSLLFLVSMLEGVPFIGSFVPGQTLVIMAGFLAKLGMFTLPLLILIISLGAIVGDYVGYLLGRRYGYALIVRLSKYFFIRIHHIERAKKVLQEHTGKALLFGRFSPITRAFTPFLAGAGEVKAPLFWIYNLAGGIVWALSSVLVGYIFGASYEAVSHYIGRFIFFAVILSIVLVLVYRSINKRHHIFVRFHLYTLSAAVLSLYVFFKTLQDSLGKETFFSHIDVWSNSFVVSIWNPWVAEIMIGVSYVLSPTVCVIAAIVLLAALVREKRFYYAWVTFLSLSCTLIAVPFIKNAVGRLRPENAFLLSPDASFPSAHATFVCVVLLLFMLILFKVIKNRHTKYIVGTISVFCILLVGISRVYLNIHWFSDVVGGFALAVLCVSLSILAGKIIMAERGVKAENALELSTLTNKKAEHTL